MGTRTVIFGARQINGTADDSAYGGHYRIEPYPKADRSKGAYQLMPDSYLLPLIDGGAAVVLEDTASYLGAYLITSPSGGHRYVQVPPGVSAINYTDCVDVDPLTLYPTLVPEDAWTVVVAGLQAQLDGIDAATAANVADPGSATSVALSSTYATIGWAEGLQGSTPRFTRANGGNPVFTQANQNLVGGATAAISILWPSIVKTAGVIATPLDAYYLYYSTDHAAVHTDSGIWLATGPTPIGPWTGRGRVYRDDAGGAQTETPTVYANPSDTGLVMLYQQQAAPGAVGNQSTCYATSTDGVTWVRGGIAIDITPAMNRDGHSGYAMVSRIGNRLMAHHLHGGGDWPMFGLSTSSDGITWTLVTALGYEHDLATLVAGDGVSRRIEWNTTNVFRWRGGLWWVGVVSNFVSGSTAKNARIAVAPISEDLAHIIAKPVVQLYPTAGAETTNYRHTYLYAEGGTAWLYYQCGNSFYVATLEG